jgi:5'-methylthioadenosine phosphorylase
VPPPWCEQLGHGLAGLADLAGLTGLTGLTGLAGYDEERRRPRRRGRSVSSGPPTPTGRRLGLLVGHSVADADLGRPSRRLDLDVESPAGPVTVTVVEVDDVVVVPRHGLDAFTPAHRVDHAANLAAVVAAGCNRVLAVGSVGSLRRDWPVGTVVAPDDLFAPWTNPSWFSDERGHRVPGIDRRWRRAVLDAWRRAAPAPIIDGGVYVQTRGPRFETAAEIRFYATVGDVVGMTVASECVLAGEMALPYAAVCMVDNLANGVDDEPLTAEAFRAGAAANQRAMREALLALIPALGRTDGPESPPPVRR